MLQFKDLYFFLIMMDKNFHLNTLLFSNFNYRFKIKFEDISIVISKIIKIIFLENFFDKSNKILQLTICNDCSKCICSNQSMSIHKIQSNIISHKHTNTQIYIHTRAIDKCTRATAHHSKYLILVFLLAKSRSFLSF